MPEFGLKLDLVSVFAHVNNSWRFSEWKRLPKEEKTLESALEITAGEESGDGYCVLLRVEKSGEEESSESEYEEGYENSG